MIHTLTFFIIGVPWRGIEGIKIDDTGSLFKVPHHQFIVTFFLYIELNRINNLLMMYDT
jgi:hypothetical protein